MALNITPKKVTDEVWEVDTDNPYEITIRKIQKENKVMNLKDYVSAVLASMPESSSAEVTVKVAEEKGEIQVNEAGMNTITFKLVK